MREQRSRNIAHNKALVARTFPLLLQHFNLEFRVGQTRFKNRNRRPRIWPNFGWNRNRKPRSRFLPNRGRNSAFKTGFVHSNFNAVQQSSLLGTHTGLKTTASALHILYATLFASWALKNWFALNLFSWLIGIWLSSFCWRIESHVCDFYTSTNSGPNSISVPHIAGMNLSFL